MKARELGVTVAGVTCSAAATDTMKAIGLIFLLASLPAFAQTEISGTCHVVDSDTVYVINDRGTIKVRLKGIAAPESNQLGGKEAADFLQQFAQGRPVRCVLDGIKSQEGEVGICYVDGQDVAGAVIKAGVARDCPAFSGGRYRAIERPQSMRLPFPDYCAAKN